MLREFADEALACPGVTRRSFLADTGMGFTGLALGAMLARSARARSSTVDALGTTLESKAKSVIWIFLCGGVSHVESFDPKPELNRYAGKSIDGTPYKDVLNPEKLKDIVAGNPVHGGRKVLMGLNTPFKKYGQSGLEVGDWWQNVGSCADDIAVVRSLWTSDNDHGAQLQFHTGRHVREGAHPTIGSWITYGLGTLNENLPEYVVLGEPTGDCCGGSWTHGAAYLGPEHAGVRLNPEGKEPLPFVVPGPGMTAEEQVAEFGLMGRLNRLAGVDYPDDPALRARSRPTSWPSACKPQCPRPCSLKSSGRSHEPFMVLIATRRVRSAGSVWPPDAWWSVELGLCKFSTVVVAAVPGTLTPASEPTTASFPIKWTCPSPAC